MGHPTKTNVAVIKTEHPSYSDIPPFHPDSLYPEYSLTDISSKKNPAYTMIRESFFRLGMDLSNYGNADWNPLKEIIQPSETVFLKPNLVSQSAKYDHSAWNYVITHGSVIRAVIDYAFKALHGEGKIIIGDGPQTDSKIEIILERTGIPAIQEFFWKKYKFEIEFIDLRDEFWVEKDGIIVHKVSLNGDPKGNATYNLASNSYFSEIDHLNRLYYGAYYNIDDTNRHHSDGRHEYMISRSAVESDVFINLPKLKTHKKVGLTLNLKNLVGINGNKNWLPHYTIGTPQENGDQFKHRHIKNQIENSVVLRAKKILLRKNKFFKFIARRLKNLAYWVFGNAETAIRSGNWHGNDTCWRMCLDLNTVLLYGQTDGSLNFARKRKRYLSIVDGIIGMDGNGPTAGNPYQSGLILTGPDPLNVDLVAAKLMGFDYNKIKLLRHVFRDNTDYPLHQNEYKDIFVKSNLPQYDMFLHAIQNENCLHFNPHFAWKGYIEQEASTI